VLFRSVLLAGVSLQLRARLAAAAITHPDAAVSASLVAAARQHAMLEVLRPLPPLICGAAAQRLEQLIA
jgi:hypothetical protein